MKVLIGILVFIVLLQFIPVDRENPPVNLSQDFFSHVEAPEEIKAVIVGACYDCHSYQTSHPWYTYIAPVSWWLKDHIEEGREGLNFSAWADYDNEKQVHKVEEASEEIKNRHMPLKSYAWMHEPAQLTDDQRTALADWFKEQQNNLNQ